eukprot:g7250.t1
MARQTIRTGSTFESEFVAASDGLIMSESASFKGFLENKEPPEDLWIDNMTAKRVAQTPGDALRPRSRHVALRYHKVCDLCDKINFCPTEHMKADCLTKNNVPREVRDHVFYHNPEMYNKRKLSKRKAEEEETSIETASAHFALVGLSFVGLVGDIDFEI